MSSTDWGAEGHEVLKICVRKGIIIKEIVAANRNVKDTDKQMRSSNRLKHKL